MGKRYCWGRSEAGASGADGAPILSEWCGHSHRSAVAAIKCGRRHGRHLGHLIEFFEREYPGKWRFLDHSEKSDAYFQLAR